MSNDLPPHLVDIFKQAAGVFQIRVDHPDFMAAVLGVKKAVAMSSFTPIVQCALLLGESGTGKTEVSKKLLEAYKPTTTAGIAYITTRVGATYVETPSPVSIDGIARVILEGLNDPFPSAGSPAGKTARIITLVNETDTRLIILDEFHNLISIGDPDRAEQVRNWLRILINQIKATVVIAGLPACRDLILSDPQLAGRFQYHYELRALPLLDNDRLRLQEYLGGFSGDVPKYTGAKSCETFTDPQNALRVLATTGGNPRAISHLYLFAVIEALQDPNGNGHVTREHFAAASQMAYFGRFAMVPSSAFYMPDNILAQHLLGKV